MNGTSKLRALGLTLAMVASAAGTGWALQWPLTALVADVGSIDVPRIPTLGDAPAPGVPAPGRPHPATPAADGAPAPIRALGAAGAEDSVGLEAMSATGAAWVQR